jgi:hypothetical protein
VCTRKSNRPDPCLGCGDGEHRFAHTIDDFWSLTALRPSTLGLSDCSQYSDWVFTLAVRSCDIHCDIVFSRVQISGGRPREVWISSMVSSSCPSGIWKRCHIISHSLYCFRDVDIPTFGADPQSVGFLVCLDTRSKPSMWLMAFLYGSAS